MNIYENPIYNIEIKEAFIAMHKDLEAQTHEVLKQVGTQLTLQLNDGKLSSNAYIRKIKELAELFPDNGEK